MLNLLTLQTRNLRIALSSASYFVRTPGYKKNNNNNSRNGQLQKLDTQKYFFHMANQIATPTLTYFAEYYRYTCQLFLSQVSFLFPYWKDL